MNTNQGDNSTLPLTQDIKHVYTLSLIITLLTAVASVAGLIYQNTLYPTAELREAFLANDVVTLFIGLPILLVSTWLSKRGKLLGLLLLPGALFFILYNYLVYSLAMPLSLTFIMYPALVMLSLYTLFFDLLHKIDGQDLKERLTGHVKERFGGSVLVGLGLLFLLRAAFILFNAFTSQSLITKTEFALNTTDFLASPIWIICGVLLWKHKEFGYITGLGMLFQGSMLFIGLIIFMLIQPLLTAASFPLVDIIVVALMGMICFVPFVLFMRGVQKVS